MSKNYIIYFLLFITSLLLFYNNNYEDLFDTFFNKQSYSYKGTTDIDNKIELSLVFITSSTCDFSNDKDLPKIIDKIKLSLKKKSIDRGYNFTTIGIATDINVENGLSHLKKFGFFDELSVGNGWSNIGTIKYVYDTIKGFAITPQLLVTKKEYQMANSREHLYQRVGIKSEVQVLRKLGLNNIKKWQKLGAPLPTDLF